MKDIIKHLLKIMTHKQKVNLWEQFNKSKFSEKNFKLWLNYYLKEEFFAKKYKLNLNKIKN